MNEDLIVQAVKQVLADPRIQPLLKGLQAPQAKPEALILLNYAQDLPALLAQVQDCWGDAYGLKVLPSDTVETRRPVLPDRMAWVTCPEAFERGWQRMVLPTCSANTLAKIALGLRDTPVSVMAAEGITRGIPVELCASQLGFTEKTPAAYRQLYEGYLKQVQGYGVIIRDHLQGWKQLIAAPEGAPAPPASKPAALPPDQTVYWNSRLLTERDVLAFPTGCTVKLGPSIIITPLAKDRLKQRRVEILQITNPL